ncbi:sugar transferase [Bradyrhizobium cajani]|uniref:Sugar transferase n=1 Tax=Bradyrhizobium cajani TaxID=1928661 RepID=A0A844T2V0_9BRAD|nr:sugar transferase [Bradyrhizobium cajani]MCP3369516.1 sugar transferase [Bradyrhizobium cajani]MVT71925.1 sugar transferase [Bradyrhizobium cajani]
MSETVNAGCTQAAVPAVRLRRLVDILGAGTAMFFLLPVFLVIALAIWIEGGRPILYSQLRLGLNGTPFRMYKFRKFRADCDDRGSPLTAVNDNRMTAIGGLLAAFKLDELPQFWNVLRGDMSLVGPRPETLVFADCFRNGFEKILEHRPGLIGPCQVLFRHENTLFPQDGDVATFYREVLFPAKAKIDLAYYPNRTIGSDLKWVVHTAWIIVGDPLLRRVRRRRHNDQSGMEPGSLGANLFQK